MTEAIFCIAAAALAYLTGSIPVGFIVARLHGVDIRNVGSGNIGATNVFRSIGKGWGVFTFTCDFLKGLAPVLLFPALAAAAGFDGSTDGVRLLSGFAGIAGHNWPLCLGFKGGKGVATSTGAVLGIAPGAVAVGLLIWMAVFAAFRYVSLASIAAAVAIAAGAWVAAYAQSAASPLVPVALTVMAILIVVRHRANIQRLATGTENRFEPQRKRST